MKKINNIVVSSLVSLGLLTSCTDFLNPEVYNAATSSQIQELEQSSPESYIRIINGFLLGTYSAYHEIQSIDACGLMGIGLAGDLMTPDMVMLYGNWYIYDYQIQNRNPTYRRVSNSWKSLYNVISRANMVIEKISFDTDNQDLKYILGQALAMRANAYHFLIQRFQQTYVGNQGEMGVPLVLTPNDEIETNMSRNTVQDVYNKIFSDYNRAYQLLAGYQRKSNQEVDQRICAGLMARAYMCTANYAEAQRYAKEARSGFSIMSLKESSVPGFNDLSGTEWMWGFDVNPNNTEMYAGFQAHICSLSKGYKGKAMDARLYHSMPDSDVRKNLYDKENKYINWKYADTPGWCQDEVYMRTSEMVLIEAEALAHQGKNAEAADVLRLLMANRDPEWNQTTVTVDDIFHQKRLELWGEGLIIYDYIRLKKDLVRNYEGTTHTIKPNLKAGTWRLIYAIPQTEIDSNIDITPEHQNPAPSDV